MNQSTRMRRTGNSLTFSISRRSVGVTLQSQDSLEIILAWSPLRYIPACTLWPIKGNKRRQSNNWYLTPSSARRHTWQWMPCHRRWLQAKIKDWTSKILLQNQRTGQSVCRKLMKWTRRSTNRVCFLLTSCEGLRFKGHKRIAFATILLTRQRRNNQVKWHECNYLLDLRAMILMYRK